MMSWVGTAMAALLPPDALSPWGAQVGPLPLAAR